MTKEELKALGLTDEQIAEVFKINGKDVEKFKTDLTTAQTELASAKEQLTTANTEIQKFKSMDIEQIKQAADDYKAKFEAAEAKSKEDIRKLQLDYKIENLLLKEGAVNTKAVKALLDASKISLDGENIIGLDEQLKNLKETETWAFSAQAPVKTGLTHKTSPEGLSAVEARFYEKNPDLKPE